MSRPLALTARFVRNLKRFLALHPSFEAVLREKLLILQENPFDSALKTHKLSGKLEGYCAASVSYDYRILFFLEKGKIVLHALGTHEEVY